MLLPIFQLHFMELLEAFAQFTGIDFLTFYNELITNPDLHKKISRLGIIPNSQAA